MKKTFLLCSLLSIFLFSACNSGNKNSSSNGSGNATEKKDELKAVAPKAEGTKRILMVGNSHTEYFASFPQMLEALCKENGKDVEVLTLLEMGVSMDQILSSNKSKADKFFADKDADGNYLDYLILQESTPIAYQEEANYIKNSKAIYDLAIANSPGVATYVYELTFPENFSSSEFKEDQKVLSDNAMKVAKSLSNAAVLPFSETLAAAYAGKEGYSATKNGKDLLRHTDNSRHMLNDAVFMNTIVLYEKMFGETPKIPAQLPLSSGVGDRDEIVMMNVSEGISNPDALIKIANSFK